MNKQEFKKLWDNCIYPSFQILKEQDTTLVLRDGSFEILCRTYNDIKNQTKYQFMKKESEPVLLDRHKVAACMVKAIVIDKPIYKEIEEDYSGKEENFLVVNELLAFCVAMSMLKAYIEVKLEKRVPEFIERESAYRKICTDDFTFPKTIMSVSYPMTVAWAWHHNIIEGRFDLLGTANLLFMIENYSLEVYIK